MGDMAFLIALGLCLALTPVARAVGLALGIVDRPWGNGLKIHTGAVPLLGGAAVLVATLAASALSGHALSGWSTAGVALAFLVGLADDVRSLGPRPRLALQAVAGVLLAAGIPGVGLLAAAGIVALTVASANAVNMVDGQDGLSGGLAAIAAMGLAALFPQSLLSVGALALAGALVGFVPWNLSRARVFLGNSGAYAVGAMLAHVAGGVAARDGWSGLLAAGLCMGVFAFELVFTVVRRAMSGSGLTSGDRMHFYDLLSALVGNRRAVTVGLWAVGAAASSLGILVAGLPIGVGAVLAAALAGAAALASAVLWTRRPDDYLRPGAASGGMRGRA